MALTNSDIQGLMNIMKPQFDAILEQIKDLKESIKNSSDSYNSENDRQRNSISDLYTKDREKSKQIYDIDTRVTVIERSLKTKDENSKFTITQWIIVSSIVVTIIFGIIMATITIHDSNIKSQTQIIN